MCIRDRSYTEGFAGIFSAVVIVLAFTAGSQLCAWMGNQIDSKGIGCLLYTSEKHYGQQG